MKKVPAKGTSGKDMDVGYDPLVRSVDPGVQKSNYNMRVLRLLWKV